MTKQFFQRNSVIKVSSLVLAILIWFYVFDFINPMNKTAFTVPITIENENLLKERGLTIKNGSVQETIDISVKARRNSINNINKSDFEAVVDLSGVKSESDNSIPVEIKYSGKEDIIIVDKKLQKVNVTFEKIGASNLPVQISLKGKQKPGYRIISSSSIPETVLFEAGETLVKSIGSVKVTADIDNLDRDTLIKKECKVYNKNNELIPELGKNLTVDVKIEVAKEVSILPDISGGNTNSFQYGDTIVYPQTALITGSFEDLAKVSGLQTEKINLDSYSQSVELKKKLVLPKGVKLYNTPREVNVSLTISKLKSRSFKIAKAEIAVENFVQGGDFNYGIVQKELEVMLRGTEEVLDGISISELKPSINLSGLLEGNHRPKLSLSVPSQARQLFDVYVDVKITKKL